MLKEEINLCYPKRIVFEVTNECNILCRHCAEDSHDKLDNEMSIDEIKKMIKHLAELGVLTIGLYGGEPLCHPKIYEIIQYASYNGLSVAIATNGTLIDEERAKKLLDSGLSLASVTILGSTSYTHDNLTQLEGSFFKAIDGIKYLQSVGIPVQIFTTLMKINIGEIQNILNSLSENGVDLDKLTNHAILPLEPTGRAIENWQDLYLPLNEVHDFYKEIWHDVGSEEFGDAHLPRVIIEKLTLNPVNSLTPNEAKNVKITDFCSGCRGASDFVEITPTGEVLICPGIRDISLGNIRKNTLPEIFDSPTVIRLQKRDYNGKCGVCEYKDNCGGCRAAAFNGEGDVFGSDPTCDYVPECLRKYKN